jgi:zinc-finger of transposase IS204/IS1001/IS1096/IS1165
MECFPTQMSIIPLFALPSGIEITACSHQEGVLCVSLLSTQSSSPCPLCGTAATRIHSHYQRRLTDLPSTGQPVRFQLSVRKFFCDESTCPRKIFTERLASFVAPRARVTARLFQLVQIIGLATGGRIGVRVTDRMGIQTVPRSPFSDVSWHCLQSQLGMSHTLASMISRSGVGANSGQSWWISKRIRSSMCCQIGRQTLQPPGWPRTRKLSW